MLSYLLSIMNSDRKITFRTSNTGTCMAHISLLSDTMVMDILRLFPCDHKAKSRSLLSSVSLFDATNKQSVSTYIRGVSDGDGSWFFDLTMAAIGWSISSQSLPFIEGLKELINKNCFGYQGIKRITTKHAHVS
eukprot:281277_1